jgi:hypothetical protein
MEAEDRGGQGPIWAVVPPDGSISYFNNEHTTTYLLTYLYVYAQFNSQMCYSKWK